MCASQHPYDDHTSFVSLIIRTVIFGGDGLPVHSKRVLLLAAVYCGEPFVRLKRYWSLTVSTSLHVAESLQAVLNVGEVVVDVLAAVRL
ncbi:hypothetical protein SAMN05421752_10771 [Natronorubrum thiooxidans]|uniref:Uncharacterized protein n=1 Tax=Natronorubrum thiooxidans TaxID=308853 RepID=A0A1N7FKP2_9EURY|nr:hypothetical protein SAMN05421752_10771 [Natronorubrum thiooxidans]